MKVTLGAHNIKIQEKTQQIIAVAEAIPHPAYNPQDSSNDIMLLKVRTVPIASCALLAQGLPLLSCSHSVPSFPAILIQKGVQASRLLAELLSPASSPTAEGEGQEDKSCEAPQPAQA